MSKTWGQLVDEGAPMTEAYSLVIALAEHDGQIPVTKRHLEGVAWVRRLADGWEVAVNGWPVLARHKGVEIPPYHAAAYLDGVCVVVFDPFDGAALGDSEERLLKALREALA